jgi:hypothetical protein
MKLTTSNIKNAYTRSKQAIRDKMDALWLKNVKCTLNSITYSDYIDFICDNRYKSMLKRNIYTPIRIIMRGFALLMEEYNETSSAPDIRTEESKKKQRQSLTEKYQIIYLCYTILQRKNSKEATERLVSMMVVQDSDDRLTMLKKCEATMKGLKFQRDQLKAAKKEQKPMTRKDYTAEFNRLQKWYGQMIPKSISMSDYVAIQNEYISYCEDLKRQKEQRNG